MPGLRRAMQGILKHEPDRSRLFYNFKNPESIVYLKTPSHYILSQSNQKKFENFLLLTSTGLAERNWTQKCSSKNPFTRPDTTFIELSETSNRHSWEITKNYLKLLMSILSLIPKCRIWIISTKISPNIGILIIIRCWRKRKTVDFRWKKKEREMKNHHAVEGPWMVQEKKRRKVSIVMAFELQTYSLLVWAYRTLITIHIIRFEVSSSYVNFVKSSYMFPYIVGTKLLFIILSRWI